MAKKRHVVRLAVGTPEEPFAPVWRIWTRGAETYIGTRSVAGLHKISLHSSGVWVAAFTVESGVVIPELGGNRRHKRWERPPEFAPGWTHGPVIVVPRVDDRHDLPASVGGENYKSALWLATPAVGNVLHVAVLFATDPAQNPTELGYPSVVGQLPLTNGETVWLVASERQIHDDEGQGVLQVRDSEVGVGAVKVPGGEIVAGKLSASVIWITTSPDGPPILMQIMLGSHNFDPAPAADS